jgi:archaellum component FlaD/FlaE
MVLGLIDFLLGGKKKNKVPRNAQVVTSMDQMGGSVPSSSNVVQNATGNVNVSNDVNNDNDLEFVNNNTNTNNNLNQGGMSNNGPNSSGSGKKISMIISKIHEELKKTNEKIGEVVTEVKSLENEVSSLGHRVTDLEENKKTIDEKLGSIDSSMTKFLSLYELINNQYNPFVEKEEPQKVVINSNGSSSIPQNENISESQEIHNFSKEEISALKDSLISKEVVKKEGEDIDSALLELDTLDIEQAAADAVPLKILKNNTNSLVIILSWLEYLINKAGIEKTRDTLRYYTETLRWITPEVFFDLDKYLKGMRDNKNLTGDENLSVRDHIVSLYFISKLNEKTLDSKLTRAVLQIIKN